MTHLFEPLTLRGVTFRNRIGVSPMCEYSSDDGFANDWHMVHLGSRAVGGAGLVLTEAAAVDPVGRITPWDLGIWKDEHIDMLARINTFVKSQGAAVGIQLAHAGRKASTNRPWLGGKYVPPGEGGWQVVAPSAVPFNADYPMPHALTLDEVQDICAAFVAAAHRSEQADYDVIEIHGAHGYLINEFLSPLSNLRDDAYGGSFENRTRLLMEIVTAIRSFWEKPLFVRLSATEWVDGGWTIDDSVRLAVMLKDAGVDLIDCSSAGNVAGAKVPAAPGYQVPLADAVREQAGIPTAAVGLITTPEQADTIIREGSADMVLLAREILRDPYFPINAARTLGHDAPTPIQYHRAY